MHSLRNALILGFLLIAIGLGVFFVKAGMLGYPMTPGERAAVWDFEIYLEFEGRDEPTRIEVFLPVQDAARSVSQGAIL